MTSKIGGMIFLLGGLAWFVLNTQHTGPGVPVDVPEVQAPGQVSQVLTAGFTNKKSEAATWSGLLSGLARVVEMDRSHPDGAKIETMSDVDSIRKWMVTIPPVPVAGGQTIGQALGPELESLGTGNEPLDSGKRQKLVQLLDGAAYTLWGLSQ